MILLFVGLFIRLWRIDQPSGYIFDEVYHVPSLRAFAQNNPEAFDVYAKAPEPNTAYDWLHPPLAKLIQAGSVLIFGDNSFGWRLPAAIFGTLATAGVYFLAVSTTKSQSAALLAAAIFSLDNLQLTMSRIAMNDIFVTAFILFALAFFYQKRWFWSAVFTGLAISTKHSAGLLYPIFLLQVRNLKLFKLFKFGTCSFLAFLIIPPLIYLFSFFQFWLQGHSWQQFVDLHRQIYYYQTHLEATHTYQSTAWQWPFDIRPVWFHVQYFPDKIANIYNLGNPVIFWGGLIVIFERLWLWRFWPESYSRLFLAYFGLWLPFIFSPRIMFLHHYLPALAVLTVIVAVRLVSTRNQLLIAAYGLMVLFAFGFFYPLNTAWPLPADWLKYWFVLPSWR